MKIILFFSFLILKLFSNEITPLPEKLNTDPKKVKLGKLLFFDPMLSKDGTISCASCHNLASGGDDDRPVSIGINGKKGSVNAPTVLNAVFNFRQFWDGRAKDLQEQAAGPIENPVEMGNNFDNLIKTLKKSRYKKLFEEIYKDGVTKNNITDAIAEYEKTLITPNSPFDRYLKGDKSALTKREKEGYELFQTKGCIACHQGKNIGGNMFNKFGVIINIDTKNLGRYNITKNKNDMYFFKVPSLRNIAQTAPYFHDGSEINLKNVVFFMAKHQLGRPITDEEAEKIVSFLKTLSAKVVSK